MHALKALCFLLKLINTGTYKLIHPELTCLCEPGLFDLKVAFLISTTISSFHFYLITSITIKIAVYSV